jgi:hypothetical protein
MNKICTSLELSGRYVKGRGTINIMTMGYNENFFKKVIIELK